MPTVKLTLFVTGLSCLLMACSPKASSTAPKKPTSILDNFTFERKIVEQYIGLHQIKDFVTMTI